MVRKVSVLLACVCLLFCVSRSVHAATPDIVNIPTQVVEIAKGVVEKQPLNTDYVLFYYNDMYHLCVGDIEFNETLYQFTLNDCITYRLSRTNDSYNSSYFITIADFSENIDVSRGQVVYSNLGPYPALIERGTYYEMLATFILAVLLFIVFILRIFSRR